MAKENWRLLTVLRADASCRVWVTLLSVGDVARGGGQGAEVGGGKAGLNWATFIAQKRRYLFW